MTFDDFVSAILHGGCITRSIFILLLILSVCTWGIIISKILQLKREDKKNAAFVKAFNYNWNIKCIHFFTERNCFPIT